MLGCCLYQSGPGFSTNPGPESEWTLLQKPSFAERLVIADGGALSSTESSEPFPVGRLINHLFSQFDDEDATPDRLELPRYGTCRTSGRRLPSRRSSLGSLEIRVT